MNVPPYGENYKKLFAPFVTLRVSAQDIPNMTVKISAGGFWYFTSTGSSFIEYSSGSSPTISKPNSGAKWVIITINNYGVILPVDGNSGTSPVLPLLPHGRLPLAFIYVQSSPTYVITNEFVFDARPAFSAYPISHADLLDTSAGDCHPVSSITGLTTTIANLVTDEALDLRLDDKADMTGTTSTSFTLNQDATGYPGSSVTLNVLRGAEATVSIRWNEDTQRWEYTEDGSTWQGFYSFYVKLNSNY